VDGGTLSGEGLLPSSYGQGGSAGTQAGVSINGGDATGGNRTLTFTNGATFTGSFLGGCPCALGGEGAGTGNGGSASGGVATTTVDGSIITITRGGLYTFANAEGGAGFSQGNATAGTSAVAIRNSSTVSLAADSVLTAEAISDTYVSGSGASGGNATAGSATLTIENSTITGQGFISVLATGAAHGDADVGGAGFGQGGTASFQTSATSSIASSGLQVLAHGVNGDGAAGTGGSASVSLGGTTMSAPTVVVSATGAGGDTELSLTNSALTSDTVQITGPDTALLDLDTSTIAANVFALSAGTMILPESPPASSGTVTAPSLSLMVGPAGSIRTYASFATTGDLVFATPEIVLGSLTTDGLVNLSATNGSLTVGNINATSATLAATGNVQAGVATLGSQQNGGPLSAASSGGSVSLGGATASSVSLSAATDVGAGALNTGRVDAVAGNLLSVTGPWQTSSIYARSADIAISANGGMTASEYIDLFSTSTSQTIVGDAQGGSWVLDSAEFSRLHAPSISIYANSEASNPVSLLIGDLTVRGAQSGDGANLTTQDGELSFFTTSGEQSFVGTAKVVGDLRGTGFTAENRIDFDADVFELDAVGGIAELLDSSGNISGVLLSRLEANPTYEGRINDINTPLAVPRPDGVVRAGFVDIEQRPPVQVLVQNTGTRALPAGFFSTSDGPFGQDFEGDVDPGSIELVINGQLVVDGKVITGQAVANQLVTAENRAAFTAESTVNACTAEGACPTSADAFASAIASEFALLTDVQLSEEPFAVEDATEEEEKQAEKAARAPIAPPVILIDTRPLNPPVDIVDPVSGSGNPALLGPVTPAGTQGDGQ